MPAPGTHTIDPIFRRRRQAAQERRRRARRKRIAAAFAGLVVLAVAGGSYSVFRQRLDDNIDMDLNPVDTGGDLPADAAIYIPTIVDLPGDPLWITLAKGTPGKAKLATVAKPADLADPAISPKLETLSDTMLNSSENLMVTIPSTQEDFAFFQAQRNAPPPPSGDSDAAKPAVAAAAQAPPASQPGAAPNAEGGWGQTISSGEQPLPGFEKTAIENNTTVAVTVPEADRFETAEETFVKVLTDRTLASVIGENHFSGEDANKAQDSMRSLFGLDGLVRGDIVALRGFRASRGDPLSLRQVSIYSGNRFVGTLAREGAGPFVSGADPWVSNDLFHYSGPAEEDGRKRQYRLLDAIYSTAARNDVPASVIGEAIMYLSRGHDLNAFASYDQRLDLVYSTTARGKDGISGRVLYAAVRGANANMECFVYRRQEGDFACITQGSQVRVVTTTNGMVIPVNGVLTATFGPSKHPILDTVRVNKGVDWVAPLATPVVAAFDGQIIFQGDSGGYGNMVRISHSDGRQTRYAHLQRFAFPDGTGRSVKAGDVIGYVGTSGVTTGPSLHFELYLNGVAVDPLGTASTAASDDSAVTILVDKIIRVESSGNVRAKAKRSSATGLGQFIDSTWLRMMRTYRPELARTLSGADLLELRFDPTISREMVRNLAREGEAYLRARGDAISAGRLYLCHFLGMAGAHQVLAASGNTPLINILGATVIQANPFLTGKDASYVINWAERKMGARGAKTVPAGASAITTVEEPPPPGFEQYKNALTALVASIDKPASPSQPSVPSSSQPGIQ